MINERFQSGSNLTSIFVSQDPDNRKGARANSATRADTLTSTRKTPLPHMLREHPRGRLVVRDIQYPFNGPRNHLEPPREPDIAERLRDCLLIQRVPSVE